MPTKSPEKGEPAGSRRRRAPREARLSAGKPGEAGGMSSLGDRCTGHAYLAVVAGLCLAVAASRLPTLSSPVSYDEGGFLPVGSQWSPGSSLYGRYWVDRPPLLIGVFTLADDLGGARPLR